MFVLFFFLLPGEIYLYEISELPAGERILSGVARKSKEENSQPNQPVFIHVVLWMLF